MISGVSKGKEKEVHSLRKKRDCRGEGYRGKVTSLLMPAGVCRPREAAAASVVFPGDPTLLSHVVEICLLAFVVFCFSVAVMAWAASLPSLLFVINPLLALASDTVEWLGNIVNAQEFRRILWSVVHLEG